MFEKLKDFLRDLRTPNQSVSDILKNPVTNHPESKGSDPATTTATTTDTSTTSKVTSFKHVNTDATVADAGFLSKEKSWVERAKEEAKTGKVDL